MRAHHQWNLPGLSYFANHLSTKDEQQLICIPLCDGAHFQGYIIEIDCSVIIQCQIINQKIIPLKKLQIFTLKAIQMFGTCVFSKQGNSLIITAEVRGWWLGLQVKF